MFNRLKLRLQDMKTITELIQGAEKFAHESGEEEPGAEHYLLSAFDLKDNTAKQVFEKMHTNPTNFKDAIQKQHADALKTIGIDLELLDDGEEPITSSKLIHHSKPSGQAVMKLLYKLKQQDKNRPILGAHVVKVIANMEHGVAARAFKVMNINQQLLLEAAQQEIEVF